MKKLILFACAAAAFAQGVSDIRGPLKADSFKASYTFATLPASPSSETFATISDGSANCTAGGGSTRCVMQFYSGGWHPVAGWTLDAGSGAPSNPCPLGGANYYDTSVTPANPYFCPTTGGDWARVLVYDPTKNGGIAIQGVTSGFFGLAAADSSSHTVAYIAPTADGASGKYLADTGVVDCTGFSLPSAFVGKTCHQLEYQTLNPPGVSTLGAIKSGQCTTTTGKLMGYDTSGDRICEADQTTAGAAGNPNNLKVAGQTAANVTTVGALCTGGLQLYTYTIPGGTLTTGDTVSITMRASKSGTTDAVRYCMALNGTGTHTAVASGATDTGMIIRTIMTVTGSSSESLEATTIRSTAATAYWFNTGAFAIASDIVITVYAYNVNSTDTVRGEYFIVTHHKAN